MNSRNDDSTSSAGPGDTRHLVARIRDGDVDGFRQLYERIAPSLYAWARVRSNPTQGIAIEPEDLLQEVWLRAFESLSNYDASRASFRSWIFGIAKNVAYESWRRGTSAAAAGASVGAAGSALEAWPAVSTSIRTRMAREESVERLMQELESFESVDRMLLVHCGMEDVPSTVVATRLGMGNEAVAKRWLRLRERLRTSAFAELLELGS
jgi:RNA polymerase sigma-70 factor (ECF subfamily)